MKRSLMTAAVGLVLLCTGGDAQTTCLLEFEKDNGATAARVTAVSSLNVVCDDLKSVYRTFDIMHNSESSPEKKVVHEHFEFDKVEHFGMRHTATKDGQAMKQFLDAWFVVPWVPGPSVDGQLVFRPAVDQLLQLKSKINPTPSVDATPPLDFPLALSIEFKGYFTLDAYFSEAFQFENDSEFWQEALKQTPSKILYHNKLVKKYYTVKPMHWKTIVDVVRQFAHLTIHPSGEASEPNRATMSVQFTSLDEAIKKASDVLAAFVPNRAVRCTRTKPPNLLIETPLRWQQQKTQENEAQKSMCTDPHGPKEIQPARTGSLLRPPTRQTDQFQQSPFLRRTSSFVGPKSSPQHPLRRTSSFVSSKSSLQKPASQTSSLALQEPAGQTSSLSLQQPAGQTSSLHQQTSSFQKLSPKGSSTVGSSLQQPRPLTPEIPFSYPPSLDDFPLEWKPTGLTLRKQREGSRVMRVINDDK